MKRKRRCSFLLINLVGLTPVVVEGCYYGYMWESKRESPLLLFLPDDDHTGDDTNHSGGVTEISECVISKWSGQELSFHSTVLVLYFLFASPSFCLLFLSLRYFLSVTPCLFHLLHFP